MTLRDQLDVFRQNFKKTSQDLLDAEEKLWKEGNGFLDKKLLDDLAEARIAYYKAENEYQKLLTDILNKKPNVDAEM